MLKDKQQSVITEAAVEEYELINPLLGSMIQEMKEFSKKKQDGVLNKLKVSMINKILERILKLLEAEPTCQFLARLDDETLPTNSDVVLLLAQFQTAMKKYSSKYYNAGPGETWARWHTNENP